jgi:NADPH-dependent curcumin reductase CurA
MIYKRVRMEGFVASDFAGLQPEFSVQMEAWLLDGSVRYQETILEGFERIPEALIGLFSGTNAGKFLVRAAT